MLSNVWEAESINPASAVDRVKMDGSDTHEVNPEGTTLYLDYLDEEMNIMGILSAFCTATVALALKELLGADADKPLGQIWINSRGFVIVGSLLILGAAASFYRQRSDLAWYYGQISLTRAAPEVTDVNVFDWLKDADSWKTWIPYRCAFFFLWPGLAAYMVGAVSYDWCDSVRPITLEIYASIVATLLLVCWRSACILAAYPYDDNPLTWSSFFGRDDTK
jgi:hypothetical protein